MFTELEQKVADFIVSGRLFPEGEKVLLAISGGADSTALLHVMAKLRNEGVLPLEICCAHINHQLRGTEAQRDEDFVVSRCRELDLSIITQKIDVRAYAKEKKLSIETAARSLRIDALVGIAKKNNCTCIATAHQKNDNAETIIQRLSRGTGFRGLCGIWPAKEFAGGVRFVRPLLCVGRTQILKYLKEQGLQWCQDRTNLDNSYRRNFIRNRVLPTLQKNSSGDIIEQLARLAESARGLYRLVCKSADTVWPDVSTVELNIVSLNLGVLVKQAPEVKVEIIRRAIVYLGGGEQDITHRHYNGILKLAENETKQLPGGVEVRRQGGKIIFAPSQREKDIKSVATESVTLKIPGKTDFEGTLIEAETFEYDAARFEKFRASKNSSVEWFDFDKLMLPLKVRLRGKGDKFWPLGLTAEKRVGKFLTGAKLSSTLRRKLLVIADSEKIIWLCPVRIGEQAKIACRTKRVLQLQIAQKESAADD
jgi:tRNA(Ile)-lysidine synthase